MSEFNQNIENEPSAKDISNEFLTMDSVDFFGKFLRSQRQEPFLSITIDWVDVPTARKLKAFLEDFNTREWNKQKRTATIRATQQQHDQEMNVFASAVKWEKVS